MRLTRLTVLPAILAVCLFCLTAGEVRSAPATYVGQETCVQCHEEVHTALERTPHGMEGFEKLSSHGCEACHGPGSEHVDNENVSLNPKNLTPSQQSEICTQCHKTGMQFFWANSTHNVRGVSCLDCHSVHAPVSKSLQLKAATVRETCYGCHADIRAQTWKRSHHPIREGKITCTDCHNPHGTTGNKMLKAANVNDLCYTCHTEKRGPFLWDHAPVRENCLNCHTPHGSNHLKLQRTSVPYLCQQCHSNTRHPGTLYDANRIADGPEASNRSFNRACTNCHSAIHGSNHPSSPYLGR